MAIRMNGGLGRVVASLPALHAANELVVIEGWHDLYALTNLKRIEASSAYLEHALADEDLKLPEPYDRAYYRKGESSMPEAFFKELGLEVPEKLDFGLKPDLANYTHWKNLLGEVTDKPLVMIQTRSSNGIRDINLDTVHNLIEVCNEMGAFPVLIGDPIELRVECYNITQTSIFDFVSLIALCSCFVGGDSSGMHIAKALDKKGIIFFTSTAGIKYYPENFIEFRHPEHKDAVELPRLLGAEITNARKNELINWDYVTPKQDLKTSLKLIIPSLATPKVPTKKSVVKRRR